ncbi:MAG: hypothetical protein H6716_21825 [Polyangiaceae bacterium]|nr:hypothetical protein [Polyangiaceae bacterium]
MLTAPTSPSPSLVPTARARWARRALSLACAALLALQATGARAEGVSPEQATADERARAQTAYTSGVEHYEAKRFPQAAKAFEASLDVVASPNARLMYARALRESGETDKAFEQMAQTQRDAAHLAERIPKYAGTAESAEAELKDLRAKVASISIEVTGGTALEVWVGQRKVPQNLWRGVAVKPGLVHVVARLPGGRRAWRPVQIQAGDAKSIELDLTSAEEGPANIVPWETASKASPAPQGDTFRGGPAPDTSSEPMPDPRGDKPPYREFSYIAAGVGGVGLLTFGIAGLMSQSTHSQLESDCPDNACSESSAGLIDRGKREQTIANIGLGVGVVGLGAAAVFYFMDQQSGASARRSPALRLARRVTLSPGFVGYEGSF